MGKGEREKGRNPKAPSFSILTPESLLLPFGADEVDVVIAAGLRRTEPFPLKGAFSHRSFEPSRRFRQLSPVSRHKENGSLLQGENTGTGSRCRMKSILREINENFPVTCQPQDKLREAGPDM